jgi:uncharacterized protein
MDEVPTSHLSPKLEHRTTNGSRGVFAREAITAGEVISVWGGEVTPQHLFFKLSPSIQQISVQIEEGLYLAPSREGAGEWVNHSCEPNAGMCGQVVLVAMRDIAAGEEVCYDYAMSDGSPYDEFTCGCGAPLCRGHVTGNDWSLPALWERYGGFFSPYLQRRIDRLRADLAVAVNPDFTVADGGFPQNGDGYAEGTPDTEQLTGGFELARRGKRKR